MCVHTASTRTPLHNADIGKPLTHAVCSVQSGHLWRGHLSKVPNAIKCNHLSTQVSYNKELHSGPDSDSDAAGEFLVVQTDRCSSHPGGLSQMILEVKMLMWRFWAGVVTHCPWLRGRRDSQKQLWRWLMVKKRTFDSQTAALVDVQLHIQNLCCVVMCVFYGGTAVH